MPRHLPKMQAPGLLHAWTNHNPAGLCPLAVPVDLAAVVSAGGLPSLSPADSAFSLLCCPHPPCPLPLRGRGRDYCYLMQGALPLASPRLRRKRHGLNLRCRCPLGACPAGCRLTLPLWCPQGACLLCRLPAPPFACFFAPIPPPALAERSSPAGKGETQSLFRRGLRPRRPCTEPLAALTDPARTGARRHHSQGTDSCRFCGEPWVQPLGGCKGRSPLHKKTKNLPLPAGKGVGGIGGRKANQRRG